MRGTRFRFLGPALSLLLLLVPTLGWAKAFSFDRDVNVIAKVWAHTYVSVTSDGRVSVRMESHSNGMSGSHIIGALAFYDARNRYLWGMSTPQCGVGRSSRYGGEYGEDNPRICMVEGQIPEELVRRVHQARLVVRDRPGSDLMDWILSPEGQQVLGTAATIVLTLL